MIYISLVILCIFFIELFLLLNIISDVQSVLNISRDAFATITSKELDDFEKEKLVRRFSFEISKTTLVFIAKGTLIGVSLYLVYTILLASFFISEDQLIKLSLHMPMIVALTLFGILYGRLRSVILKRIQSS